MNFTENELRTMDAMAKATDYYLKIYPVVWMVLSLGNLVSLVVFLQKDMRRVHCNVYLAFLAVADTVFAYTSLWTGIQDLADGGLTPNNMKFWAKGKLWEYFLQSSAILTGWLLVVISVDRFVMVFFPLWSKSRLTPRKAFIFTSLTSLPFIIYPIHNLIGRDGLTFFDVENTTLAGNIRFAEKFVSKEYEDFYLRIHFKIIAPLIHFSSIVPVTVLNAAIVFKLYRHSRNRSKTLGTGQSSKSEASRTTVMLVTVNIIALLLRVPFVILNIIAFEPFVKREFDDWWLAFWYLTLEFSYSLLFLNSCINFFIYISMSTNFKRHFMRIFCPCCKRDDKKLKRGRSSAGTTASTAKTASAATISSAATAATAISHDEPSNTTYM